MNNTNTFFGAGSFGAYSIFPNNPICVYEASTNEHCESFMLYRWRQENIDIRIKDKYNVVIPDLARKDLLYGCFSKDKDNQLITKYDVCFTLDSLYDSLPIHARNAKIVVVKNVSDHKYTTNYKYKEKIITGTSNASYFCIYSNTPIARIVVPLARANNQTAKYFESINVSIPYSLVDKTNVLSLTSHEPIMLTMMIRDNGSDDVHSSADMTSLEKRLYLAKRQMDYIPDIKRFEKLSNEFKISNTFIKPIAQKATNYKVSQAFLKMTEMLHLNIFPKSSKNYNVFHLCEAPGQFILAFEYYAKHHNIKYEYKATSLIAKGALGDVYGIIKANPNKWIYGDGTGDITHRANIVQFSKNKYNIVTSDCGWNESNYGFQEDELAHVNACQLITELLCGGPDSTLIFKTFLPLARALNIYLIYILYTHSKKLIYYKPSLNPNSSEIYIIAVGYNPVNNKLRDELLTYCDAPDAQPTSSDAMFKSFKQKHFVFCEALINNTINCIRKMILYYYTPARDMHTLTHAIAKKEKRYAEEWVKNHL